MTRHELLSDSQRKNLLNLPDSMDEWELIKYYTFSQEELKIIKGKRGDNNRLGFALQWCYLRFPGRNLARNKEVPEYLLHFTCIQIGVTHQQIYERDTTRKEHLLELQNILGVKTCGAKERQLLINWLLPIAMKIDNGLALVLELIDEIRRKKLIIPATSTLESMAWSARETARNNVSNTLLETLTDKQRQEVDKILALHTKNSTVLSWLRDYPENPCPDNFLKVIERLEYIRQIGIPLDVQYQVHQNRFIQLAREGNKYSAQYLARFEEKRRYSILVAFLLKSSEDLIDQALLMHERMMIGLISRCKKQYLKEFQKGSKAINDQLLRYVYIGKAVIKAREEERDAFQAIETVLSWEDFIASIAEAEALSKPDSYDFMILSRNKYQDMRRYTVKLLSAFEFKSSPPSYGLLKAVNMIKELNMTGQKKLPNSDIPTDFLGKRWLALSKDGNGYDRRFYEICSLIELKNHLRSGDMWVSGSKQFKDFQEHLLSDEKWKEIKESGKIPVAVNTDCNEYLKEKQKLLQNELKIVSKMLQLNLLEDAKMKNGRISISRLDKDVPDEIKQFVSRMYALLPRIKVTDLLVEVDSWTHFSKYFTHLYSGDVPKNKLTLFSTILAEATNMGFSNMEDACPGVSAKQLIWLSEWYIRDDNYSKAQAEVINFQHKLPFALHWGEGKTSSSDGQSIQITKRKGNWAHLNPKYGKNPSVTFYTHISDQYAPYYTQVINSSAKDATYVLDGLLYHETDLTIEEHYTDTAGFTDHVFVLCHFMGFRYAPRIRDLADKNLYVFKSEENYPLVSELIGGTINTKVIRQNWNDILKLTSSIKLGTVNASLIIRKLGAYPRQNNLALALRELGRLERTIFILEWIRNPKLRRRVQIGLNKGEARNALADAIFFYRRGIMHDHSMEDHLHRASALNLVISAIVLWNSVYLSKAVEFVSKQESVPDDYLQHLSPLGWEHINLTGDYIWNLEKVSSIHNLKPLRNR